MTEQQPMLTRYVPAEGSNAMGGVHISRGWTDCLDRHPLR